MILKGLWVWLNPAPGHRRNLQAGHGRSRAEVRELEAAVCKLPDVKVIGIEGVTEFGSRLQQAELLEMEKTAT